MGCRALALAMRRCGMRRVLLRLDASSGPSQPDSESHNAVARRVAMTRPTEDNQSW